MYFGFRFLYLLAIGFYASAMLMWAVANRAATAETRGHTHRPGEDDPSVPGLGIISASSLSPPTP